MFCYYCSRKSKTKNCCYPPPTVVYFIQEALGGYVKIGYTRDLNRRMRELDNNSPAGIYLLGYMDGARLTESTMHDTFALYRKRGEWYHPNKLLIDYIDFIDIKDDVINGKDFRCK